MTLSTSCVVLQTSIMPLPTDSSAFPDQEGTPTILIALFCTFSNSFLSTDTSISGTDPEALHVEEDIVLGAHPHCLPDDVHFWADVPPQDIGSTGTGGQQASQDGPGKGGTEEKSTQIKDLPTCNAVQRKVHREEVK